MLGTGSDSNDGKTAKTASCTLQEAANVVQRRNTVLIENGNYTNEDRAGESAVLNIKTSGTKNPFDKLESST